MTVALSTDHAGFNLVDELKLYIEELGHSCNYYGPTKYDPVDDYPKYIFNAAKAVASGKCKSGIILGGSGQGEAMAANRVLGVRACLFYSLAIAKGSVDIEGNKSNDPYEILKLSRHHNHSNILSLSARFLNMEEMKKAIKIWLSTPYSNAERHVRRIHELDDPTLFL